MEFGAELTRIELKLIHSQNMLPPNHMYRAHEVRKWLDISDSSFRSWHRAILSSQKAIFSGVDICLFLILRHGIQREGFGINEMAQLNWTDLQEYMQSAPLSELINKQIICDIEDRGFRIAPASKCYNFEMDLQRFAIHLEALFHQGILGTFLGKHGKNSLIRMELPPILEIDSLT